MGNDKNDSIVVSCVGDITPVCQAYDYIIGNEFFQKELFHERFLKYDIVFGNLETPVTDEHDIRENKRYNFRTNERVLDIFPGNFIFSLANNHMMDYGNEGLMETLSNLKRKGIRFTGAGENIDEAGKPVIIECKGKKLGFITAADKIFGTEATKDSPGVFPADSELLISKIGQLRKEADIIYLSIHMGNEYIPVPTPAMKKLADECYGAGSDVIVFNHAHCVSGYTLKDNKATLWGAGNFIFPASDSYHCKSWFETALWQFHHNPGGELDFVINPHIINKHGLPEEAEGKVREKILKRIERLSKQINSGKNLEWLRRKNMFRTSYLRLAFSNYADLARRSGFKYVFTALRYSIKSLFGRK